MSVLQVSADAPELVRIGAATILALHIGGGLTGIVSGAVALLARKGERLHRIAGNLFFVAMLTMSAIGATVSPFLPVPAWTNVIAGVMTFYLVATAWVTVRRNGQKAGAWEIGGFIVALTVAAAGVMFILQARNSPTGTVDGAPPQAFYVFLLVGSIAALSDLKVIVRGGISGAPRIARHLWRMCVGLLIAEGSFFLGQEQLFPKWLQGSAILFLPELAVFALLIFWMLRVRFTRAFKDTTRRAPAFATPAARTASQEH